MTGSYLSGAGHDRDRRVADAPGFDRLAPGAHLRLHPELRPVDHRAHRADTPRPPAARDQADPLDAEHAGDPAEGEGDPAEVQGEPTEAERGGHEGLPGGGSESSLRVLADAPPASDPRHLLLGPALPAVAAAPAHRERVEGDEDRKLEEHRPAPYRRRPG